MVAGPGLAVALLAAGGSTRFGVANKLAADLGGRPLIGWAAAAGRALPADHHLLIAPAGAPFDAAALGYRLIVNPRPEQGMAHSLHLAAQAAREAGAQALLILLADMPFVTPGHLRRLLARFAHDTARPVFSRAPAGIAQPPALFPATAFAAMEALEGDRGARALAGDAHMIDAGETLLLDVDTLADLIRARALADRSEKQKMLAGEPYLASDPELVADQQAAAAWMARYNGALALPPAERNALLREGLADLGPGSTIRPPFHCDYGYNIRLGNGVFMNFNCVILDVAPVTIGDGTQIGPGVQILTADHPRDPAERATGAEWGRPIIIGRNVWIGGGAIILPGVTIGDDAVIGAGSIVTRDVPAGVTVVGNPARPSPAALPRPAPFSA